MSRARQSGLIKYHKPLDLNKQTTTTKRTHTHLFLIALEAERSKIKVPLGLMSYETFPPALQMASYLLTTVSHEEKKKFSGPCF